MSKRKKNHSAEGEQQEFIAPVVSEKIADTKKISNAEDAIKHVRHNYNVPPDVKVVYVSEDKQVFFRRNPAMLHTNSNDLKLFSIKWD